MSTSSVRRTGQSHEEAQAGMEETACRGNSHPACQRVADKIGKMGASAAMSYKAMALPGLAVGLANAR